MSDWESKLLLFLSVDITGSTKYKNSNQWGRDKPSPWRDRFDNFYQDFPSIFKTNLSELSNSERLIRDTDLWKILGDEILFHTKVSSLDDIFWVMMSFCKTIRDHDSKIGDGTPLRLKGTAWTAGFPVRNTEIKVPLRVGVRAGVPMQDMQYISDYIDIVDYIGPEMDAGFRLCKYTRPGRVAISMDVADFLSRVGSPQGVTLYHVGWEILDGVLDNNPYPIIWLVDDVENVVAPWERQSCKLTKKMSNSSPSAHSDILDLVRKVRRRLSYLGLVEPYFSEEGMPEQHKRIRSRLELDRRPQIDINDPFGSDQSTS